MWGKGEGSVYQFHCGPSWEGSGVEAVGDVNDILENLVTVGH